MNPVMQRDTLTFDLTLLALVAGDMNGSIELEKDMSQSVGSVQSVNDLKNSKSDTQSCRDEIPAEKKGKSMSRTKLFLIIIILNHCLCLCLAHSCHILHGGII